MAAAVEVPQIGTEVPPTLLEPAPRPLGLLDQLGLWGNLGVSLLGFGGALAIVAPSGLPRLPLGAALLAAAVGTVLGTLAVALSAVPGAVTGAPAMVLLRGLFGARIAGVPTLLNIVQCLGWGTFELVVIADGALAVAHDHGPRWLYVVVAGLVTTGLSLRPLGAVRLLRRYVSVLVVCALAYFAVKLVSEPTPAVAGTSWRGFWAGADVAIATAVSWVPLASDYSRHSRAPRSAFLGSFVGYGVTQLACYAVGLVALALVGEDDTRIFAAFLAVPAGAVFLAVLVLREVDQSFANVYSTAVSVQNLRPTLDRRVLAVLIGGACTGLALAVDITGFASFLYLIGSVFVPLFGVFVVDWYVLGGRSRWDLSESSPARPWLVLPWLVGFVVYQLVNPGAVGWWASFWTRVGADVGLAVRPWMSASAFSFVAAGLVTLAVGRLGRR